MIVRGIKQKTDEWKKERRAHYRISASESCVAAGLPGYKGQTPMSLYRKIIDEKKNMKNQGQKEDLTKETRKLYHLEHGEYFEDSIIKNYTALTGYGIIDGSFWVSKDKPQFYSCSPDAVCLENGEPVGLLEAKAPFGMQYGEKISEECDRIYEPIKLVHMCQMQYSLFVTGLPWVDFMSVRYTSQPLGVRSEKSTLFYRVYRSEEFIVFLVKRVNIFIKCLMKKTPVTRKMYPPYTDLPKVVYEKHPFIKDFFSEFEIDQIPP